MMVNFAATKSDLLDRDLIIKAERIDDKFKRKKQNSYLFFIFNILYGNSIILESSSHTNITTHAATLAYIKSEECQI